MYTHPASLNGVMSFLLPSYFMKCKPCVAEKSDDSDWVQNVSKYAKNQILHDIKYLVLLKKATIQTAPV